MVSPPGHVMRRQGWKLHLSATPVSAEALLRRALPVLVAHRCAAKFAADRGWAAWLSSARCPRGAVGKFLTAYPDDDQHFRRVAWALDEATTGLSGPQILSDRRYRPGSLVYYRFGGFTREVRLDDDGCYRPVIFDPDGRAVEDRREAWFTPPSWVEPVLPHRADEPLVGARPVLVGGRFAIRRAIRHSSRGGVFLGTDQLTGAPVVVKQARAFMDTDPSGRDCRDRLRREARLLGLLAPRGLAPQLVGVVEEAEDLFVVRAAVDGRTLRRWVSGHHHRSGGVPVAAGLAMARALAWLLDTVHEAGLVLVDVSPNNIMVDSRQVLWLTDLDNAAWAGEEIFPVGTPGYIPPEHFSDDGAVAARPEADLFGLGGLLFQVAVGTAPVFAADDPPVRPYRDRLKSWLAAAGTERPLARRLGTAIVELTHERPESRWRPQRVRKYLDRPPARIYPRRPARLESTVDQLIEDWVSHLVTHVTLGGDRLWATSRFGASADPCAVQHGAAGVLGTLVRAAASAADPEPVRKTVALAGRWIEERLPAERRLLPGLYYGRSGTAWALYEAATLLGDARLAAEALELALRLPVVWGNPDIAHGAAGAGTALLHLWDSTGDPRLAARISACAEGLLRSASGRPTGASGSVSPAEKPIAWPIAATMRSKLKGRTFHGYAHGTAGIASFLLAAGARMGRQDYVDTAQRAAQSLADAVHCQDGAAFWPAGPGDTTLGDAGWCKGSAGIGTFVLQMWRIAGQPRYLDLARAAATAVYRFRPHSTVAACHGLAGGGQFLLDLADTLQEDTYRRWAWDLADLLAIRSARRGGRVLLPDETGQDVTADYGVGLAGAVDFLVRLRHGGPGPWAVGPERPVRTARVRQSMHHEGGQTNEYR